MRDVLEIELAALDERHNPVINFVKAMGSYAPTMGMIGTVVGLINMLGNLSDPAQLGLGMSTALLTTLYGAVIANLIALPISDKLSTKGKITEVAATLTIDGVMQLAAGKNPNLIREMLVAYLPEKQRLQMAEAAAAGAA